MPPLLHFPPSSEVLIYRSESHVIVVVNADNVRQSPWLAGEGTNIIMGWLQQLGGNGHFKFKSNSMYDMVADIDFGVKDAVVKAAFGGYTDFGNFCVTCIRSYFKFDLSSARVSGSPRWRGYSGSAQGASGSAQVVPLIGAGIGANQRLRERSARVALALNMIESEVWKEDYNGLCHDILPPNGLLFGAFDVAAKFRAAVGTAKPSGAIMTSSSGSSSGSSSSGSSSSK